MVACTELGGKTRELAWLPEAIGTVHAHRDNKIEVPGGSQTALFDVSTQNNIEVDGNAVARDDRGRLAAK